MRESLFNTFLELKSNKKNYISFYNGPIRTVKTYSVLHSDIESFLNRINYLKNSFFINKIGIIGPTSYYWMLIDLACIKGGIQTIAFPEHISNEELDILIQETDCDFLLIDELLQKKYKPCVEKVYYFNCRANNIADFQKINEEYTNYTDKNNCILQYYGIGFSSGTSSNFKHVSLKFNDIPKPSKKNCKLFSLYERISEKLYGEHKILIFMPFSHIQQRQLVYHTLLLKRNILLSNPANCLIHLILDKPNAMVSVPVFFEALANRISDMLEMLPGWKKVIFNVYNKLGINKLSNRNIIKLLFSAILFKKIKKVYGGRGDFFNTGSAPIDKEAIKIFYSVGIKLYEGYGLSEVGLISKNTTKNFKIGSVGKPGMEVKISETSEILVRSDEEIHRQNKSILKIDNDGFIHTGDMGYIDKDGYLFVQGRIDDVIVLPNGKKVFPENIEQQINKSENLLQSIVFLDKDVSICTVIVKSESANEDSVIEFLNDINKRNPSYQKIYKAIIVSDQFTVENSCLTSTFKLRRKEIIKIYKDSKNYQILCSANIDY